MLSGDTFGNANDNNVADRRGTAALPRVIMNRLVSTVARSDPLGQARALYALRASSAGFVCRGGGPKVVAL